MFVGSEGTLGLTVEAKLRLVELPRARATLVVEFAGLLEALAATPLILEHAPAAVEVVDQYVLDSTRLNPEASRLRDFLHGDPAAILLIELYGDDAELLTPRLAALEDELRAARVWLFPSVRHETRRRRPASGNSARWRWGFRWPRKGTPRRSRSSKTPPSTPKHLRDYIDEFLKIIARHRTKAGVYAHASVGCLHVRPVINLKTEEGVHTFEAIAEEVSDLVLKYGGATLGRTWRRLGP